ncbi:MAG: N-acetylmannosamine-6-phosphate 2-epimerase, partial [Candidatus Sericytochromatia bacterium]
FARGMAEAAALGGAAGLRLNGPDTIVHIKAKVALPIIGIWKQVHPGSDVYITPTLAAAEAVLATGAEILALDATSRPRPAESLDTIVAALRGRVCLMADISTLEEGLAAEALGFDCVGTTLSGYTPYSPQQPGPDYALLSVLVGQLRIPIIMEGRIWTPEAAGMAIARGAHAVVVGSAITRPQLITKRYVEQMKSEQF